MLSREQSIIHFLNGGEFILYFISCKIEMLLQTTVSKQPVKIQNDNENNTLNMAKGKRVGPFFGEG